LDLPVELQNGGVGRRRVQPTHFVIAVLRELLFWQTGSLTSA
jgi:hypothetical protein